MAKYRKKPVEVEARQLEGNRASMHLILGWILSEGAEAWIEDNYESQGPDFICIETLEGTMKAGTGDYIIQGVNGEFYPCKPDIFEKTYDPVEA